MKTLITEDQLRAGIRSFAEKIQQHYQGRPLTLVGVMVGSIMLLADLIRFLDLPMRIEIVQARTQPHGLRSGPLVLNGDVLASSILNRHVLVVDDIFDTGRTLWDLIPQIDDLGPISVRIAVLLQKEGRREVPLKPDFTAFTIPNEFVVGYGLDYCDKYRNLPYIAALEPQEMEEAEGKSAAP